MRELHLFIDRQQHAFVAGIDSGAPPSASCFEWPQGDKVRLVLHDYVKQPSTAPRLYAERSLVYSGIRASILRSADQTPERGTFRLRVDDQTTSELTWPSDLSTQALRDAWKTTVLDALKALSNVGASGIRNDDPEGTPAHFFYLSWTDPLRDDEIEVLENRLVPWSEASATGSFSATGYTQLLKFVQLPLTITDDFDREDPPEVTVTESRPGAAGTNAEQTIAIPAGAVGSVSFVWNGSSTKTLAVDTMTAESLEAALNAIVPAGDSNPSFAVEARRAREGERGRYAVEFIGPLASAAQAMLVVGMHDQEAVPYASGILDLDKTAIEAALNGESFVDLLFELVIDDQGEETFLRTVRILNDGTSSSTIPAAESTGGAVRTIETTVYVDAGLGDPFVEAAPGLSFIPPAVGSDYTIAHALDTRWPHVRVFQKITEDPEEWRQVPDNEFSAEALSASSVRVTFPFELSDDEEVAGSPNPLYRGNWKIYIGSPDAQLVIFEHNHTFDQVLDYLPDGPSLRTKLTQLEALIGMVGGTASIPANLITGLLTATQIDIASIITSLSTTSATAFAALLTTTVENSSTLVSMIATKLATVSEFAETLKTVFESSETLQTALVSELVNHTEFRSAVISALQLGPGVNTSFVPITIPDLNDKLPELAGNLPFSIEGPTSLGNVTGYLPRPSATNAGKYYTVVTKAYAPPQRAKTFADGAIVYSTGTEWFEGSLVAAIDATTISSPFELEDVTWSGASVSLTLYGSFFKNVSSSALSITLYKDAERTISVASISLDSVPAFVTFAESGIDPGDLFGVTGFEFDLTGISAAPDSTIVEFEIAREVAPASIVTVDYDKELFTVSISEQMLATETTLTVAFAVTLQLLANCEGYYLLELLLGHRSGSLSEIEWDATVISQPIVLTDAAVTHGFVYTVARDEAGDMTSTKTLYTKQSAATAPESANFILRARLSRFDTEDVAEPKGQLIRVMTGARASIANTQE